MEVKFGINIDPDSIAGIIPCSEHLYRNEQCNNFNDIFDIHPRMIGNHIISFGLFPKYYHIPDQLPKE